MTPSVCKVCGFEPGHGEVLIVSGIRVETREGFVWRVCAECPTCFFKEQKRIAAYDANSNARSAA